MVKNSQQISPRGFLKMFQCLNDFLSRKQKCSATEKMDGNCHVFANNAGKFCRASYWLIGPFPRFFIQLSQLEHFPSRFPFYFGISQRFSNSLSELPKD
jgi:hypothetical protein